MTKVKWDEILAIVDKDCKIRSVLIDQEGQTCVIGALALASGITQQQLVDTELFLPGNGLARGISSRSKRMTAVRVAIRKRFGLTMEQMMGLQEINDSYSFQKSRQAAIRAWVEVMR